MSQRRAAPPDQSPPSASRRTAGETWDALVHVMAEGDAEDGEEGDSAEVRQWAEQVAERARAEVAARRAHQAERAGQEQTPTCAELGQSAHGK